MLVNVYNLVIDIIGNIKLAHGKSAQQYICFLQYAIIKLKQFDASIYNCNYQN